MAAGKWIGDCRIIQVRDSDGLDQVLAVEVEKSGQIIFWLYFEDRAIGILWQTRESMRETEDDFLVGAWTTERMELSFTKKVETEKDLDAYRCFLFTCHTCVFFSFSYLLWTLSRAFELNFFFFFSSLKCGKWNIQRVNILTWFIQGNFGGKWNVLLNNYLINRHEKRNIHHIWIVLITCLWFERSEINKDTILTLSWKAEYFFHFSDVAYR